MPNIWIVFAFVLWEGLLGGGAYVNTFYRMSTEVMQYYLTGQFNVSYFAMQTETNECASFSDSKGGP